MIPAHGIVSKTEKTEVPVEFFIRCLFGFEMNEGVMTQKAMDCPLNLQIIQCSFLFLVENISLGGLWKPKVLVISFSNGDAQTSI